MNAEAPTFNLGESKKFLTFWREVTGAPHITLTSIMPDGETTTATFTTADTEKASAWIAREQNAGRNIYFEVNEAPAGCTKKPTKAVMQAALCRHADIDPEDDQHPYPDERARLHRLAEFLRADPLMPPTAIIDSGNGIQPLWAIERESLNPERIERIENENRAIEAALGAAGTHNIDRLLRLPGTLNFPNAKKRKLGRGISRARLLHSAPAVYSAEEAALLGDHLAERLADSGLVHKQETEPELGTAERRERGPRDRSRAAIRIGAEIRRDGGSFDDLVAELRSNPETADWFKEKGQRANLREVHRIWQKTAPRPSKSGLPVIYNAAGHLPQITAATECALLKSGLPLFQRGRMLVRPIVTDVPASHGRTTKAAGLEEIGFYGLVDLMAQSADWQRWDARSETWARDDPNGQAAHILLTRAGSWSFPQIAGIITTPTLRPDGTVLLEPGYDPATRLYHAKDEALDLRTLPAKPTKADADRALDALQELLAEFPFVGPVDRAVALSGMITPVVRGALPVAPMHTLKAPAPSSGKSYLVDTISAIGTGRVCPVSSASEDAAETEKRLVGLLLAGYPVVSIDNVNGELGGDFLCQAVERPMVRVRALGRSDTFEIECRASIYATGNALRVVGDMVRRTLVSTLDPGTERPELREFTGNPVAEIMRDRGRYVAACLTIALAYRQAGCPDPLPPLASFEEWSAIVRSSLVWLGCPDPCISMQNARENDPELNALREMLALWRSDLGEGLAYAETVRHVAEKASGRTQSLAGEPADFAHPDLRDALLRIAGIGGNINTRRLGTWLADHEGRIVDGFKFTRHPERRDRTGVPLWAAVKAQGEHPHG